MKYLSLSDNQRRIQINAFQLFDAALDAERRLKSFGGSLVWKTSGKRQYLFKLADRRGNGRSMGPRTPETEKVHADFHAGKVREKERLRSLQDRLAEQIRFNRAALIGRVPNVVAHLLDKLRRAGVDAHNMLVIGTNALYAYETMAGVFFDAPITATTDVDLLWDNRARLKLLTGDTLSLMRILQSIDPSFERLTGQTFRAANKDGFLVDLIRQLPNPPCSTLPDRLGPDHDDLVATDIWNMKWLLSAPRIVQPIIAENGQMALMPVLDPRAFAAFKLWLAHSQERSPTKRPRDLSQAEALLSVIHEHLPQYPLDEQALKMFPKEVAAATLAATPAAAFLPHR
ncbi:MAG: nucleotidyltransferase domain-containing protein [Rhodocyclales bacterium]|nr:nucleotidyltransferase domain-containing protein [Rhodocyclales bacterium]